MKQSDEFDAINASMHRVSLMKTQREIDDDIKARNWAICDAVCSVGLVVILALLIGGVI